MALGLTRFSVGVQASSHADTICGAMWHMSTAA